MSDRHDNPKPGKAPGGGVIPPGLEPFVAKRAWPKTQKLGEDPDLDAAVAAYKALDKDLGIKEEPPVQDLSVGMGNASAYSAPTEVKPAKVPGTADSPRVEFGLADVPRALPEGNPTRETDEIRVLRLPPGGEDEPTIPREAQGRTVGGGTERLPLVRAGSPWAKDAAAAPVAPVELPSAHAPSRGPASESGATTGRGRGKSVVLAGALFGVAAFIVFRVATTRTDGARERPAASSVAATTSGRPSAPAATAPTTAPPPASVAPSPSVQPTGTAARPETPGTSTSAPTGVPSATSGGRVPPGRRRPPDDPYDPPVAPSHVVTAVPAAPPATAPSVPPTTAPPVPPTTPPPQPAAAPKPPASGTPFDKPNYD